MTATTARWIATREHAAPDDGEHAAMCYHRFEPRPTFEQLRQRVISYVVSEGLASTDAQVRGRSLDLVGQISALEAPELPGEQVWVEADQLRYTFRRLNLAASW